jgi:hypothetical protein
MSENVGASTSHNPKDLHVLYGDNFTRHFQGDQIVNNEMGNACSTHDREATYIKIFDRSF